MVRNVPFTIAAKKIKCLEIQVTRNGQNLYEDNFETLLKDEKAYLNNWNPSLFLARMTIVLKCQFFLS